MRAAALMTWKHGLNSAISLHLRWLFAKNRAPKVTWELLGLKGPGCAAKMKGLVSWL